MIKFWSTLICSLLVLHSLAQKESTGYDPHKIFRPNYNEIGSTYTRAADGSPNIGYWQNQADYIIKATLQEETNTVVASVTIVYTNNSPLPLNFLWLQLDQNLYKADSRGQQRLQANNNSRYGDPNSTFDGGYKIEAVQSASGTNIPYVVTDTRMQLLPTKPIQKGESIQFTIKYNFNIPPYGADRSGILETPKGNIYTIAQWFPRLCVYDDIRGWNTDPYLGPSEFYCEYGNYQVSITAPASHIVVAGGKLLNAPEVLSADELKRYEQAAQSEKTVIIRSDKDLASTSKLKGLKTWNFELKNARDFAWASSKAVIWDGAKINLTTGNTSFAQSIYPTEVKGTNAWGRSTEYVKGSVENYSKRWYPYPYPVAVNVASNVGGMEYPAIVFCGVNARGSSLFGVTDHEFGHTWFPMIVGSNERLYGWMDEGFNTFINGIASRDFNNGEYADEPTNGQSASYYMFNSTAEGIMLTPDGMQERNIGNNLYAKPGYALELLRNEILGPQRFDFAFREYIKRWAFKHPTPLDFFRTMNNAAGENLDWYWRSWFINDYRLDQAVTNVSYNNANKYSIVTLKNLEEMAMPVLITYETASGKKGSLKLPVEIWSNTDTFLAKIEEAEPLKYVTIDEMKRFPDINFANNTFKK